LEQVRLLTNLETTTQKLLQIILIGQPELRELLARNELRQLAQRITGRYHLNPLSRGETAAYVRHRLRVAGATADILSPHALNEVFRLSHGVPRVINIACDRALLGAYSLDRHRVTAALVRSASSEVFGRRIAPHWLPWALGGTLAAALAAATFALWNLAPWGAGARGAHLARADTVVPAAAASAVGTATSAPAAPREPHLGELLTRYAAETDTDSAFDRLLSLWGAHYERNTTDPCTQAMRQGLECVTERGSFGQLRQYNRPAILLLNDGAGASHEVVLTALDDEQGRIELGGPRTVRLGELSRYWLGDFIMLWRPASSPVKALSAGMRGAEVRWLRRSLQRLHGVRADAPASEVFDAELTGWVRDFQRQHQLAVDGIAGVRTQIALASALGGSDTPPRTARPRHAPRGRGRRGRPAPPGARDSGPGGGHGPLGCARGADPGRSRRRCRCRAESRGLHSGIRARRLTDGVEPTRAARHGGRRAALSGRGGRRGRAPAAAAARSARVRFAGAGPLRDDQHAQAPGGRLASRGRAGREHHSRRRGALLQRIEVPAAALGRRRGRTGRVGPPATPPRTSACPPARVRSGRRAVPDPSGRRSPAVPRTHSVDRGPARCAAWRAASGA